MQEDDDLARQQRTERDIATIRRGLALVAADTPATSGAPRKDRPRAWLVAVAAAVALAVGTVAVVKVLDGNGPGTVGPPTTGMPANPMNLRERVAASSRIVIGTVVALKHDRIDSDMEGEAGDPYVLATIRVDEAIKGPADELVAFAYAFNNATITTEGSSRPWSVGDNVLLFLVPDVGTISSDIDPPHLQVAEGEAGRYFVEGNRLQGADFTLDDVRREAR